MRVTYVARSFLDYRIPVLEAMRAALGDEFRFIYSADYVPARCHERLQSALGSSAIGLRGEWRIGPNQTAGYANRSLRVVHQPGLWRAIADSHPTVVVGDGFFQWTSLALAYRIRRSVGLVLCYERTFHTERSAQALRTAYRKWVMRWVDAMACNGSLSREYSVHLGIDPACTTEGQMAADSNRLVACAAAVQTFERDRIRKDWGSPDLALISVGRLIRLKGYQQLLDAWKLLESRHPGNWRLVIAGEGPERDRLTKHARALGLHGVHFGGHVEYEAIARLYAAADALVMPTLEDNWSLVVPEAMVCGLPVLCSVYNGCHPELVHEGINGWVFDPKDVEGAYQTLLRCVDARAQLPAMGRESRRIAEAYTPARAAEAILAACRMAQVRLAGRS